MSFSERKNAGIYGHSQYANYLGAKLEHLNLGEPLFKSSTQARKKVYQYIQALDKLNENESEYPSHVAEMQRRAIAKWLATEILAHKFNSDFVFDLDEYRPYTKKIREIFCLANLP
ncbi:MAG: hypothetical protein J7K53_04045 [Bacteroidales bacterium]|nr:hypothetical protein [Bacteroidales bacterium]